MVNTRSQEKNMAEIVTLIEQKFEEFKKSLLNDLKMEPSNLLREEKKVIDEYIAEKKGTAEKKAEALNFAVQLEITTSLESIKEHVKKLQTANVEMREANDDLKLEIDDLHQYIRRPNIRLYGIKKEKHETSKQVEDKIVNKLRESFPDMFAYGNPIDRVHRTGNASSDNKGYIIQPIIVRFTSFRDRTTVSRGRKDFKKKLNCGMPLDLTKSRLKLLNEARDYTFFLYKKPSKRASTRKFLILRVPFSIF